MTRAWIRKMFLAVTSMALALTLVGGAYALTGESEPADTGAVEETQEADLEGEEEEDLTPEPEPTGGETEGDEEDGDDVHGGSVERIHEGCEGVEGLEGNWTHGDYVSAIAALGDPEATKAAAKSDCGKPLKGKRAREAAEVDEGEDGGDTETAAAQEKPRKKGNKPSKKPAKKQGKK